jgi:hypothetical protein
MTDPRAVEELLLLLQHNLDAPAAHVGGGGGWVTLTDEPAPRTWKPVLEQDLGLVDALHATGAISLATWCLLATEGA